MAKTETPKAVGPSAAERLADAQAELAQLSSALATTPSADPDDLDALTAQLMQRGSRRMALETMMPALERAAMLEHLAELKSRLTPALHEQASWHDKVRTAADELDRAQREHVNVWNAAAAAGQRVETITTEIVRVEHELGVLEDKHGWAS